MRKRSHPCWRHWTALALATGTAAFAVGGCATAPRAATDASAARDANEARENNDELREFTSQRAFSPAGPVGCRNLVDAYCTALYSPRAGGNLRVPQSEAPAEILQGETRNDFSRVFVAYAIAKLHRQGRLPSDFQAALARRNYFVRLKQLLMRKPRSAMSVQDRVESDQLERSLVADWQSALDEATLRRVRKKFPEFHALAERDIPIEWQIERRRTRRALVADVSTALWSGDPNWKRVERGFGALRESFLELIDDLDAPDELRAAWRDRVQSIELVLPSSRPALADDECGSTKANAYYYSFLNVLTVCAGDFNSEDILQTVAHEMAHALDLDRSRYLFQTNSTFGRGLATLRHNVCSASADRFTCDDWTKFKAEFPRKLAELRAYRPELPEFNRCLARRPIARRVDDGAARAAATRIVRERFADLASSDYFLRIVKAGIPLPSGKMQKNPNYLNPCSYYMWTREEEPIDDSLSTLVFFTAEYRCSTAPTDADRLRSALAKSQEMSVATTQEAILNEGEFSNRRALELDGLSSSPVERFADVVGSHALARALNKLDLIWERRNLFLASSSWQCEPPGLASSFPTESAVQREWELDAHSEGRERLYETLSRPVREALLCEKDFDFAECSLPLKSRPRAPATAIDGGGESDAPKGPEIPRPLCEPEF